MNFIDSISDRTKENWAELYKRVKGKKWKPPVKDKRAILCETKIDPEEIKRMITEKPNYSIEMEGRE